MTDIAIARIEWRPCFRIVPSRFPPINLFEAVADPADLDAVYQIEAMTNDRLREEVGDISLVPPEDRVSGPGSSPIMAAFTHLNPEGDRFTNGTYGVFYAGRTIKTAIAETRYHRTRFLQATNEPAQELDMRVYAVDLDAELHDIREMRESHPAYYHPTSYGSHRSSLCNSAKIAPVELSTEAFVMRVENVRPCFAPGCFPIVDRNGTSATSGTEEPSRPFTRRGVSHET